MRFRALQLARGLGAVVGQPRIGARDQGVGGDDRAVAAAAIDGRHRLQRDSLDSVRDRGGAGGWFGLVDLMTLRSVRWLICLILFWGLPRAALALSADELLLIVNGNIPVSVKTA